MESINHFKISAILSPVAVAALFGTSNPISFLILSIYGLALGVLIDLDHFIWARYNHGHWNHFIEALESPFTTMKDNAEVMENALGEKQRYASHFAILVLGTVIAYVAGANLAALTSTMLGAHIVCDTYASYQEDTLPV